MTCIVKKTFVNMSKCKLTTILKLDVSVILRLKKNMIVDFFYNVIVFCVLNY